MITERINIDVRPGGVPIVVHVTQYEVGLRTFEFVPFTSSGEWTDVNGSATLEGTKPDGNAFQQACTYVDGIVTYVLQEQLCAVHGRVWSRLVIRNIDGDMIGMTAIVWDVGEAGVKDDAVMSESDISALRQFLDEFGTIDAYRGALNGALAAVGGPLVAATASAMTDRTKVYVYTGSESGYTEGHWYYWNGSAWTDGGVYQSTGINTDKTLTVEDMAADAKATGDAVAELKNDLSNYVAKSGTKQVTEQNTTFFTLSDNIFNYKTAISGKRLTSNGGLMDASAYVTSDYIDVSNIDYITGYRYNGSTLSTPTLEYAMYNGDFSVISGRSGKSGSVDVRGVAYIRFDGTDSIKNQYMIVDSSKTVTSYIPYETTFKYALDKKIHLTPADDIIQSLIENAGSTFVFDDGAYDIIAIYESKYGSDYFTNYNGYSTNNVADRGLPVLRGSKIICTQGAVFTCNYTGANSSVRDNFSAFALESAVEINDLRVVASGIRNCIHDDFDNFYSGTTPTVIKNCLLEHDRMVIAGGLAKHDVVIIENCIFNDTFVNHVSDFYYHNNSNEDAQSLMIIKDCYLNKGIGIKYYGSSTKMTDVIITNNSMANAVDFGANRGATVENMRIKEWNNIIRS